MKSKLTDLAVDMIEHPNFGHLATLMPDGSPQVTPVWVDHEGDFVLINTVIGRLKQRNVTRDPRVAVDIIDQTNPYQKVYIRGRVVDQIRGGAEEHIDNLAHKYLGTDKYQNRQPGEQRIILKIEPEHVSP
jgi:PPOX class probable F420-dependent enzyme